MLLDIKATKAYPALRDLGRKEAPYASLAAVDDATIARALWFRGLGFGL